MKRLSKLLYTIPVALLLNCSGEDTNSHVNDVGIKLADGKNAVIYRQGNSIVFKLCASESEVMTRECDEHPMFKKVPMHDEEYFSKMSKGLDVAPPYDAKDGKERLIAELADIEEKIASGLLTIEETDRAEFISKRYKRTIMRIEDGEKVTAKLNDGDDIVLNENFQERLVEIATLPFENHLAKLPGLPSKSKYWLDPDTGYVWQKLPHTLNWYDANEIPREEPLSSPIMPGCKRHFGRAWSLPNMSFLASTMKSAKAGIPLRYKEYWWVKNRGNGRYCNGIAGDSYDLNVIHHPERTYSDHCAKDNRNVTAICMARFDQVFQDDDYDHDGVPNNSDFCHEFSTGSPVDERGCEENQEIDQWRRRSNDSSTTSTSGNDSRTTNTSVNDSDGDGVNDHLDKCPNTPRGKSVWNERNTRNKRTIGRESWGCHLRQRQTATIRTFSPPPYENGMWMGDAPYPG